MQTGKAVLDRFNVRKSSRVLDLFFELANDKPADISVFVALNCDKPLFVGSQHIEPQNTPHPVWFHLNREFWVNSDFCVLLQANSESDVTIAVNQFSQYLIRVAVSDE
jgi:hypothetical protein